MVKIGFTSYDTTVRSEPTVQEVLLTMTNKQKRAVLEGFIFKTKPVTMAGRVDIKHSKQVVKYLYEQFGEIETLAASYMRGEVLLTPATTDEEGVEVSPAKYNEAIKSFSSLEDVIADDFGDVFTKEEITAILTKIVKFSKKNGSGTWNFYKKEVRNGNS